MTIQPSDPDFLPRRTDAELEGFTLHDAEDIRCRAHDINYLLSYLESKTEGTRLAKRADISPAEIRHMLPNVAILRLVYGKSGTLKDIVVQLMGTTLSEFYGEQTGKSIFDYADQEVPNRIFTTCNFCQEKRRPVVSTAETFSADKPYLSATSLMVPLSEDGEHIDRIFAHLSISARRYFTSASQSVAKPA